MPRQSLKDFSFLQWLYLFEQVEHSISVVTRYAAILTLPFDDY